MKKPDMSFWQLWNISFGFLGVQIAYALQSANISRIFATLGADPHNLSYFWILPPLMGMIVQPIVGSMSDRTWTRWGRRKPYLFAGALVAVLVMILLPNSGSLGLAVHAAMSFGLFMLMLLDTSINMAMQPFKMLVGDMVNDRQKSKAYSIQSFLCNTGSLIGFMFPFVLTWLGVKNVAVDGVVPDSVIYSFYIGAAILILCVIYTSLKVKEMNPQEYEAFHGITEREKEGKRDFVSLLFAAPKVFWSVGLVQFFAWAAFMYMWTYCTGATALNVWGETATSSVGYQEAGNWVGVLFAVQALGSVVWAVIIPLFKSQKFCYSVSLALGGLGFILAMYMTDKYMLFIAYALIGCAWAATLALPFAILTNSLSGRNMGAYLGLFNCTICLPQIIAALVGGLLLKMVGGLQPSMLGVAGASLLLGSIAVWFIKTQKAE
ncbi:MAG: SLC45 family MFS transporter [Rikenellaceae bacterium]